jgi:hypothetical protein
MTSSYKLKNHFKYVLQWKLQHCDSFLSTPYHANMLTTCKTMLHPQKKSEISITKNPNGIMCFMHKIKYVLWIKYKWFGMCGIVEVYILDCSWNLFGATMWGQLGNLKICTYKLELNINKNVKTIKMDSWMANMFHHRGGTLIWILKIWK